ncbi:gamma-glutamylcyclotransferase [Phycisphaerales bacterium AB-hyl4]|uniref:Gamma-glutamylcyclotransferase n=1 Tax=Natronomicrosphaera hydrolytica TaxID=3242702 RepID=A0ABV4U7Z8_9BACT
MRYVGLEVHKRSVRVVFSVHDAYPAPVAATRNDVSRPGVSVEGEVYSVDEACMKERDAIEGVAVGLYERRQVELLDDMGNVDAFYWLGKIEGMTDIGHRW